MQENNKPGLTTKSKIRLVFYWLTTVAVAWELIFGGALGTAYSEWKGIGD